jgi:UDP-glucose 4-epimerase
MTWIVTGGAGYIGSHIVDAFVSSGESIVVYDSMLNGHETRIRYLEKKHRVVIPIVRADIRDSKKFENSCNQFGISGIVHTAALKSVRESFEIPEEYMDVNVRGTENILNVSKNYGIIKFIFSSTAAVYGNPKHSLPVSEGEACSPVSPYGETKYLAEKLVENCYKELILQGAILRYFNVIGTSAPELADVMGENLIPLFLSKIKNSLPLEVFGSDYPTQDGTCVRDYVDVRDVARAHLLAATTLNVLPARMNIGTGVGESVLDVINNLSAVMGMNLEIVMKGRRQGDPAFLCADPTMAAKELGFLAQYSLRESIESVRSLLR